MTVFEWKFEWLNRCWSQILETKYAHDKFEMLMTDFAIGNSDVGDNVILSILW